MNQNKKNNPLAEGHLRPKILLLRLFNLLVINMVCIPWVKLIFHVYNTVSPTAQNTLHFWFTSCSWLNSVSNHFLTVVRDHLLDSFRLVILVCNLVRFLYFYLHKWTVSRRNRKCIWESELRDTCNNIVYLDCTSSTKAECNTAYSIKQKG